MARDITLDTARALLPPRPFDGHKGNFGHVLTVAGSRGFTGAAKLATLAALRSGAGLVTLAVPFPLGDIVAAGLLEAMSLRLPATEDETFAHAAVEPALAATAGKQAVVLGPGIGRHDETEHFVREFASACPVPLIIDADGLNSLDEGASCLAAREAPTLLTPHPGEMSRLSGLSTAEVQADRENVATRLAASTGAVVVLKGHRTVVAAPDGRAAVNTTGNHGMAKGGTGDVLAGLLGGLLAQGLDAFDAACLGVLVHGLAGDFAARDYTPRGMLAGNLLSALPEAWGALQGNGA